MDNQKFYFNRMVGAIVAVRAARNQIEMLHDADNEIKSGLLGVVEGYRAIAGIVAYIVRFKHEAILLHVDRLHTVELPRYDVYDTNNNCILEDTLSFIRAMHTLGDDYKKSLRPSKKNGMLFLSPENLVLPYLVVKPAKTLAEIATAKPLRTKDF